MHYWVNQYIVGPNEPGGTRHVEFASRLRASGINIELVGADINHAKQVYTRRAGTNDRQVIREDLGTVVINWLFTTPAPNNDWRRAYGMLRFGQSVLSFLIRAKASEDSVFIGSSPQLFAALATELAARLKRAKFVFEVRDIWPDALEEILGRKSMLTRALNTIANYLYRRADTIIVLAQGSIDAIAAKGIDREKILHVPNSIDPKLFERVDESVAQSFPLPVDKLLAVYAGAHGPANNLETVVESARLLKGQGETTVHIVLVGDGPSKEGLRQLVQSHDIDNVTLLDPIAKSHIPALFSRCEIGILTLKDVPIFRYGVSPNKLFDYMAAGLAVVSNVAGECATIVSDAGSGVTVATEDPQALADALAQLAADRAKRSQFGENGPKYVEKHFNRDRLVERLEDVLNPIR